MSAVIRFVGSIKHCARVVRRTGWVV